MVMACLATVQRSGWRVPDDAAIIGVGDEIFSRYTTPTLTAISILTAEIGRRAADMLLTQINDEPLPETGGAAALLTCVNRAAVNRWTSCGATVLRFDPTALLVEADRLPVTFYPAEVPGLCTLVNLPAPPHRTEGRR
jgi:hypothetical protein